MSIDLKKAAKLIAAYKEHIKDLPKSTPRAYTFTREEIEALLKQDGKKMDGIRIYFGAEMKKGVMVPRPIMVGCVKNKATDQLDDYGIPEEMPKGKGPATGNGAQDGGSQGGSPCPSNCGKSNFLN
ncbi:hypothetical protein [Deminuibacter soli]|uniref:Uncharacterized protein n=1 Tax=Deminuibacter soli TaxID=2291815 RepID=A0A3E1NPX3_9BACT|nr:hypothetical protein [Deminuibacter soli]RFM29985.1 hypothetical protein DXN05_03160 [Deminuibacter soli]